MSDKRNRKVASKTDGGLFGDVSFTGNGENVDSLMESLNTSEQPKKLSLLMSKEPDNFLDEQEENDDEEERERQKQESRKNQQALLAVEKPKGSAFGPLSNFSPTELDDHYVKCIQLCNENKVNQKNAFKLQLIDCMKIIFANKSKKADNLVLMGCSLDASAKIYSYRVDKVYTDMTKVMSGKVFKESKEAGDDDEEGGGEAVDQGDSDSETPQKKRKKNRVEDDELDYGKYLCSEKELQKTQTEGDGLLKERTTLPPQYEYFLECPLRDPYGLLSLNCPLFDEEEEEVSTARMPTKELAYSDGESLDPSKWLPGYGDIHRQFFLVKEMNGTILTDKSLMYDTAQSERTVEHFRNFDGDDDMEVEGVAPEPIVDYDDDFSDCEAPMPGSMTKTHHSLMNKTSFSIKGMSSLISLKDDDYSFFDSSKINFWAGPSHWSIKPNKKRLGPANNPTEPEAVKGAKKQVPLDFDADASKMEGIFRETIPAALTRKTLKSWTKNKNRTLSLSFTIKNLLSLFGNKSWLFMNKDLTAHGIYSATKRKALDESGQELTPEAFSCREEDDADVNMLDDFAADVDDDPLHEEPDGVLELIPAPQMVNKITINYSKSQKSVDIKLLKNTIWKYMDLENTTKENTPSIEVSKTSKKISAGPMMFSEVFRTIPRLLPAEESPQLSCGVVFMSLLHMANEKVLSFQGTEAYDDFCISLG